MVVVVLSLTACGSSSKQQASSLAKSAQTRQAEAYARTVAEGCVNKGGGLRAIFHCAVPPHHGAAFLRCVLNGVPKKVKGNDAGVEADLVKCGERFR